MRGEAVVLTMAGLIGCGRKARSWPASGTVQCNALQGCLCGRGPSFQSLETSLSALGTRVPWSRLRKDCDLKMLLEICLRLPCSLALSSLSVSLTCGRNKKIEEF